MINDSSMMNQKDFIIMLVLFNAEFSSLIIFDYFNNINNNTDAKSSLKY